MLFIQHFKGKLCKKSAAWCDSFNIRERERERIKFVRVLTVKNNLISHQRRKYGSMNKDRDVWFSCYVVKTQIAFLKIHLYIFYSDRQRRFVKTTTFPQRIFRMCAQFVLSRRERYIVNVWTSKKCISSIHRNDLKLASTLSRNYDSLNKNEIKLDILVVNNFYSEF